MLGQRHQAETAVGPSGAAAEFRFLVRTPPEAQGMPPEAESPTGGDPQTPALVRFPLPNPTFAKRANKAQRLPGGTFRPYASPKCRA